VILSGERTRLACWRSRPRDRELFLAAKDYFGEAPKPAREGAFAPRKNIAELARSIFAP